MALKITNQLLLAEAERRGWQTEILDEDRGVIRYTTPKGKCYVLKSNLGKHVNIMQRIVADDKQLFYQLASEWNISIPQTLIYNDTPSAIAFLKQHGRLVVKPKDSAHGNGIDVAVTNAEHLKRAVVYALRFSNVVLLQEFISGQDYRLLFIGGKHVATAIRTPAEVTGDGVRSIKQLIVRENRRPSRGVDYQAPLNRISVADARRYLGEKIEHIPAMGKVVQVVGTANIGTGGYAIDATADTPPEMVEAAQGIVDKLKLSVCGVDFLLDPERGAKVIEINASPSFGLHTYPYQGQPQPVAALFLDWLQTQPTEG